MHPSWTFSEKQRTEDGRQTAIFHRRLKMTTFIDERARNLAKLGITVAKGKEYSFEKTQHSRTLKARHWCVKQSNPNKLSGCLSCPPVVFELVRLGVAAAGFLRSRFLFLLTSDQSS
jgi:hypothetical protein